MKTYDEAHWAERDAATDCRLCEGTGWLHHGQVASPVVGSDDLVHWTASLVACSHPASPESPGEVPTSTPDRDGCGVHVRPENRGGADSTGPAPVASLDEQRAAHDAQVEADRAAYEKRTGGGS